jgi:hypothetical protein
LQFESLQGGRFGDFDNLDNLPNPKDWLEFGTESLPEFWP